MSKTNHHFLIKITPSFKKIKSLKNIYLPAIVDLNNEYLSLKNVKCLCNEK